MKLCKSRTSAVLLSAMLLTGCAVPGGSQAPESSPAAESTTVTSATTASTEQTTAELTTAEQTTVFSESASGTASPSASSATTLTESTASTAATTAAISQGYENGIVISELLANGSFAATRAKGKVVAKDGLNLRAEPSMTGKKVTLLKLNTEVDVTGIYVTGQLSDYEKRWIKVKSGNNEGYVLAEYLDVQCSLPAEQLSCPERAALAVILYYQGMRLHVYFHREGGSPGYTHAQKSDSEGFQQLLPKGLKLADLKANFHKFFSKSFTNELDDCYREHDGYLWVATGYGDNVLLDSNTLEKVTEFGEKLIRCTVKVHWRNLDENPDAYEEWEENLFDLVYEDGFWKISEMTPLY